MVNEKEIYSYKNGFSEGVVFAFYQERFILCIFNFKVGRYYAKLYC